jgi:hypothetical protein
VITLKLDKNRLLSFLRSQQFSQFVPTSISCATQMTKLTALTKNVLFDICYRG